MPNKKHAPAPRAGQGSGVVRIIGGQWRRTRLGVVQRPHLRPTPARVRETLFNWLGHTLDGWHCLDAFAGTGALGLEAASRGAASVLLLEQDPALVRQLQTTCQRLRAHTVRVQRGDALQCLCRHAPGTLHLVLLDPPFSREDYIAPALQTAARALAPGGFVYLEAARLWDDAQLAPCGLQTHRHLKAAAVHAHLLRHAHHPGDAPP